MLQRSAGVVLAVALLFFLLQRSLAPQRAPTPTQAPASHPRLHHDSYSLPPAIPSPQMDPFLSIFRSARHRRPPGPGSSADHRQGLHQKTGHTSLHPYPKPTTPRRPPTGPRPRQGFLPPGRRQHISPLLLLLLYGAQSPFSHPAPRIINQKNIQNKCNSRS